MLQYILYKTGCVVGLARKDTPVSQLTKLDSYVTAATSLHLHLFRHFISTTTPYTVLQHNCPSVNTVKMFRFVSFNSHLSSTTTTTPVSKYTN